MSPHAVFQRTGTQSNQDLDAFCVSRNAFLPEHSPLKLLQHPSYQPWELLAHHLPSLVKSGIREAVERLPVLPIDNLKTKEEQRRAYLILAFLTQAYVWGGEEPKQTLPPQLAVPFRQVSNLLELPPVLTYAAANLWNFTCNGDDFSNIDDLDTLVSFTGTKSESWFLLISVAMEARAGAVIGPMTKALEAVKTRDYEVIISALNGLRECIDGVAVLLERMYENCDPMEFYYKIRPYLAGSKGMEAAGLPNGVFYDEGDGKGEWLELRGGSNGQSSLIQFFDIVLGVEHKATGNKSPEKGARSYHEEIRSYMPGPHRRFLEHIMRMGSIRELVMLPPATEQQQRLRMAYTDATEALTEFRNKHIQIVTRYIILPSRQAPQESRQNLASSSLEKDNEELTGTGGTTLVPFLKQSRDETSAAGRNDDEEGLVSTDSVPGTTELTHDTTTVTT